MTATAPPVIFADVLRHRVTSQARYIYIYNVVFINSSRRRCTNNNFEDNEKGKIIYVED